MELEKPICVMENCQELCKEPWQLVCDTCYAKYAKHRAQTPSPYKAFMASRTTWKRKKTLSSHSGATIPFNKDGTLSLSHLTPRG